jgi:hypothetical protein
MMVCVSGRGFPVGELGASLTSHWKYSEVLTEKLRGVRSLFFGRGSCGNASG